MDNARPDTDARSLQERLDALEAVEEIKKMKYRYWRACDGKDPEGFRRAFIAKGASLDYGPLGSFDDVEPILGIYRDIALRTDGDRYRIRDMHHGMHPDITLLSPTVATGRWTLRFRQFDLRAGTETVTAGEYDDRYVVEDGAWKHSQCHFQPLWSITRPVGDDVTVSQTFPSPGA